MARPVCGKSFLPRADKRVSSPKHFRWAPICTTIWYWSSYRRGKLSCRGKLPTRIFVLLQPFPCREIMIIDQFLVALLSFVCLVLTDSSSLVTRLTEECHRSDGERSLEWQTPAVAYPFGSLHDLCVAVVVVLLDEVVHHFRQDLSILLIICQINSLGHLFDRSGCSFGRNNCWRKYATLDGTRQWNTSECARQHIKVRIQENLELQEKDHF